MANTQFSYLLECIISLAAAGALTSNAITDQYLYQVISEKHNYSSNSSMVYCDANVNATSHIKEIVSDEVSSWKIYMSLVAGMPAIVTSTLIISWSDKIGRKIPLMVILTGFALSNILQLLVVMYRWPLFTLIIRAAVVGLIGGFSALINIGMTYVSDVTTKEQKVKRYALLECCAGLSVGLVNIGSGFWITADGFLPSSWFAIACLFVSMSLTWCLPSKKNCKKNDADLHVSHNETDLLIHQNVGEYGSTSAEYVLEQRTFNPQRNTWTSSIAARLESIWKVYSTENSACDNCGIGPNSLQTELCQHGGGLRKGRVWRIWCHLLSFDAFLYPSSGLPTIAAMYFLSYPLCFTPTYLGIYLGILYGSFFGGLFVVAICKSLLKWKDGSIVLVGIHAAVVTYVLTGVSIEPYQVFISSSLGIFSCIAFPVMRSQISSLASDFEQGAALSLISGTETFMITFGQVTYLLIYPATLNLLQGFIWYYSTFILVIPLILMIVVRVADKRISRSSAGLPERRVLIN